MKCPHCFESFHEQPYYHCIGKDDDGDWITSSRICPECKKIIIILHNGTAVYANRGFSGGDRYCSDVSEEKNRYLVHPKSGLRPCPK